MGQRFLFEKDISMTLQKKITDYLKSKGAWCIKVEVANERGCPDILACVRGQFWGIEIKSERDFLSVIQIEQIQRILRAGGAIKVVRDFETFKKDFELTAAT